MKSKRTICSVSVLLAIAALTLNTAVAQPDKKASKEDLTEAHAGK
jgi:hypothetical protein